MRQDSSRGPIERIVAWLRGFVTAGRSAADTSSRDAAGTAREGVEGGGQRVDDLAGHRERRDAGDTARSPGRDQPARAAQPPTDAEIAARSDFDDAAGDIETGEEIYPAGTSDLDSATHVHDAVGGENDRADDATDGTIDTTRDAELRPGNAKAYQHRDIPLQDNLIAREGASSDEFDGDEITVGDTDTRYVSPADVEAAAEGYGDTTNTDLDNTTDQGTSAVSGSTFTETDVVVPPAEAADEPAPADRDRQGGAAPAEDPAGNFHVVERYNYGMGDLGVGAGTAPADAWSDSPGPDDTTDDIHSGADADMQTAAGDAEAAERAGAGQAATDGVNAGEDVSAQPMDGTGFVTSVDATPADAASGPPDRIDASVSPEATRSEIESQSRGDAVNRSDEATQTPGFGPPETFGESETGTTQPSRSATSDDLDTAQDALGTTLDFSDESDAFDEGAADLSDEDELTVTDDDVDLGAERNDVERVATFQSGTIAHDGLGGETAITEPEVTDAAYADLADEPRHATADDSGLDDDFGSAYPSDRIVDPLAGDDFTEAEEPDVPDLDSSAGDLDNVSSDPSDQVDYVAAPVERTIGDAGSRVDQDLVGTSDEHVGGEEPDFAEAASRGTDETADDDLGGGARAIDVALSATDGSGGHEGAGARGDAGVPAGAVRGDGTTATPDGYPIKGNASSMIYHLPHFPSYKSTKAEFCFATEQDAINAGYRAPGKRNRGRKS